MTDAMLEDILNRADLPRQVAHNLVFKCRVYWLKDELQKDVVENQLKVNGYSTFWGRYNYFNGLFLQEESKISPRIVARGKIESLHHRILIISDDAVFLYLNRLYGLVIPPEASMPKDPNVFYLS